ncbi:protein kinase domain protein, partial [Cystoisospora suis]
MNKPSCFSRSKAFSWPFISLHLLLLLLSLHSVDSLRLYPHGAPRRGRREKEEKRQGAQDGVVIVEEEPETSHKLARAFFQGDFKDNATAQGIYSLLQSSQLSQRKEDEYKDEQESVTFFPGESSDRQGFRKGLSQEDLYRGDDRPTGNGLHSTTYNQISAHGVHTPEVLYGEVAAKDNGWGREEEKTTEAKPVRSPHEQSFIVSPHGHTPSSTSRRREQAVSSFPTMNPPPLEKGKSLLSRDGSSSALEESSLDGDYPGLSLTEEEASAGSGDVEGKKGKSLSSPQPDSLAFLGGTSFSEQNPPRLPLEISEKATPQLSSREEQVQRAAALPLCEISSSVLGNLLGSGTYGGVYPLVKTSPCSSITRDFVAKKFAVKIFRLRKEGMMELFDDLEEGSVPSLTNLKDSVITAIKGEL